MAPPCTKTSSTFLVLLQLTPQNFNEMKINWYFNPALLSTFSIGQFQNVAQGSISSRKCNLSLIIFVDKKGNYTISRARFSALIEQHMLYSFLSDLCACFPSQNIDQQAFI